MKILQQKPLFAHGRIRPFVFPAATFPTPSIERIKAIGTTTSMDDYEKRKLGIFNQLNFFQLLTGVVIPIAGLLRNHQFPALAWVVACMPALVSVLVLGLNAQNKYYLAQIAYFVLYPFATSIVYFWGINLGVELSFIL